MTVVPDLAFVAGVALLAYHYGGTAGAGAALVVAAVVVAGANVVLG